MNKIALTGCMAAALLAATACSTTQKVVNLSEITGEWNLTDISGKAVTASEDGDETPYIAFDTANGRLSGSTGCNRLMGSFDTSAAAGTIDLSQIASTRMMCPDPSVEDAYLKALGEVKGYTLSDKGDLELLDSKGDAVLTFTRRVPALSGASLAGEWKIEEVDTISLATDTLGEYTMTFTPADSTFSAATGCNTVMGKYVSNYVDIKFDNLGTTRMACPDMSVEEAVNRVLPTVSWFGELASGNVGFYTPDNDLVLILSRK